MKSAVLILFLFFGITGCQNFLAVENPHGAATDFGGDETDGRHQTTDVQTRVEPQKDFLTIGLVGDVILHERLRTREEKTHEGYQSIWKDLQSYFDRADITYANLEGPVAPEIGGVSGFPKFNFPEKIISSLKNSGFKVVSTANNHALDRGAAGIKKTLQNLRKYKLGHTGTISSESAITERKEVWWQLIPFQNKYIAWLSCTEMTNGLRDKDNQVLYCFKDLQKVKDLIRRLRQTTDIAAIIVLPHWGEEEDFEIQSYRRRWAHIMLNLGASAIVGSHPHVVQKIENYITEDKRQTVIAYSLGNFISNQPWNPTKASMLLFLKFKAEEVAGQYPLESVKYIPIWMKRTLEKDGTSKYRLGAVFDFKKVPKDAAEIWSNEIDHTFRLRTPTDVENFLSLE